MKKPRDSQRARVYRAERAASDRDGIDSGDIPLDKIKEIVRLATTSNWWRWCRYDPLGSQVCVTDGRGARSAAAHWRMWTLGAGNVRLAPMRIRFPRACRGVVTVAHELAHVAVGYLPDGGAHGPVFCAAMLHILEEIGGDHARRTLCEEFEAERVRYQ